MTRNIVTLSAFALATLALPAAQAAPENGAASAKETIEDVRAQALTIADQSFRIRMMAEAPNLYGSQGPLLGDLRENVNQMGKDVLQLDAERDQLAGWEQQALDSVVPLVQESATDATKVIEYYNHNRTHPWGPEDAACAQRVLDASSKIASTLKYSLKSESLREQEDKLKGEMSEGTN